MVQHQFHREPVGPSESAAVDLWHSQSKSGSCKWGVVVKGRASAAVPPTRLSDLDKKCIAASLEEHLTLDKQKQKPSITPQKAV